jgi:LIVCS family branched-chain amino acid:cation transporter
MNTIKRMNYYTAGLTIFAMFFGAGNIFLPLALSQHALDKTPWALSGFLITAVAMPIAGLLAMFLFGGHIRLFFSRLGRIPGLCIAFLTIALLGPFGAAPRCIALAHSTLSTSIPGIPLALFSGIACVLVFCFVYRKNRLLKLIGYVLAPFKVSLLIWIIIKGFMDAPSAVLISSDPSEVSHVWHGIKEGYKTMDLLAAFFFAPIIISSLACPVEERNLSRFVIKASAIGAFLLATVYIGFCYLAYFYAPELKGIPSDQLLGVIAIKVLGPHAGLIVSITVSLACLTTTIALIAAFASFMQREILNDKFGHIPILIASLLTTFAVTTLEFQGIANLLNPILKICYPVLILLTFYNLIKPLPLTIKIKE